MIQLFKDIDYQAFIDRVYSISPSWQDYVGIALLTEYAVFTFFHGWSLYISSSDMSPFLREIYPVLQYDIIIPRGHEVARAFRAYSIQMLNCFWSTNVAIIYLLFGARFEYFVALIPYLFSISYFVGNDMTGYNSLFSRSQIMIVSVAMVFIAWASFDNFEISPLELIPEILFPAIVFSITLLNLLIFEFSGWTYPALK